MTDWFLTSNLLQTALRALADAARRAEGTVDHVTIHRAIAALTGLSKDARDRGAHEKGQAIAARRSTIGKPTNVGDPMEHGPSPAAWNGRKGKGKQRGSSDVGALIATMLVALVAFTILALIGG